MRIRNDFVTNSSSSSFIIAIKGDDTEEVIREALQLSDAHPLCGMVESLIAYFINAIKSSEVYSTQIGYVQEKLNDGYEMEDLERWHSQELNALNNGFKVFKFYVSNEDCDHWSQFLYENRMDIISNDIIIRGGE